MRTDPGFETLNALKIPDDVKSHRPPIIIIIHLQKPLELTYIVLHLNTVVFRRSILPEGTRKEESKL
jgi:hypothetical protein